MLLYRLLITVGRPVVNKREVVESSRKRAQPRRPGPTPSRVEGGTPPTARSSWESLLHSGDATWPVLLLVASIEVRMTTVAFLTADFGQWPIGYWRTRKGCSS
jgi:hypothetical protein